MSYIDLINEFWLKDEEYSYSGSETRLYFYLLKCANSKKWKENTLAFADGDLMRGVRITANTLKEARNRLATTGLIKLDVKKARERGRKSKDESKCKYLICGIKLSKIDNSTDNSTHNFSHNSSDNKPESLLINKEEEDKRQKKEEGDSVLLQKMMQMEQELKALKEKEEKKKKPLQSSAKVSPPEPEVLFFPFDTDRFRNMWAVWLSYKVKIKDMYKTHIGQQAALKELAPYGEEVAIKMIEQAIAKEWKGIYPLKDNTNATPKTNSRQSYDSTEEELNVFYQQKYGA